MTIEKLKQTKEFEIFMRCIETAVYPKGFHNDSLGYWTGYSVETEHYKAKFGHNGDVELKVELKRPDENATSSITIGQINNRCIPPSTSECYYFLKDIYDSSEFARGKWIQECSESFDSILVKEHPRLNNVKFKIEA